ncbi:MAG: peptidoglycan-binding domain-containing protein [Geminicoccaceae bacterium]
MDRLSMTVRRAGLAGCCAAALALAGCANDGTGFGGGTIAGAAGAGTLAGVATRNRGPVVQTASILGAAALGGFLGDRYVDQPRQQQAAAQREAAADRNMQRQLDFERQSQLQAEQTRREIEEQRLFEQWQRERAAGAATAGASSTDVLTAQRLLRGLGYYNGPLDGDFGPQTRSAVIAFERARGLPQTGTVTPALLGQMRAAI